MWNRKLPAVLVPFTGVTGSVLSILQPLAAGLHAPRRATGIVLGAPGPSQRQSEHAALAPSSGRSQWGGVSSWGQEDWVGGAGAQRHALESQQLSPHLWGSPLAPASLDLCPAVSLVRVSESIPAVQRCHSLSQQEQGHCSHPVGEGVA